MSTANYTPRCGGEQQQPAGDVNFFYHVPQHSRRDKLRFPTENTTAAATALSFPQGFALSLSPVVEAAAPVGPFTGYAAVLNRSGFVEPARQLLEEICQFGRGDFAGCGCQHPPPDADAASAFAQEGEPLEKFACSSTDHQQGRHLTKIKLVSMLDEVYKNYRAYHQHVEAVIASFETVAGLNTAVPYVSMALISMSRSFRSLKNAISSNLNQLNKVSGKREISGLGLTGSSAASDQDCPQRRNVGSIAQVWRPQRGLPEHAVGVLKAWLFQHFLHPYPTDNDKQLLAKQTALTRNQVSNWFINARVRLWKPMVEEIHNLELLQLQKSAAAGNTVRSTDFQTLQPSSSPATSSSNRLPENISPQVNYNQNRYYKPSSIHDLPRIEEPSYFVFNDYIGHGQAVCGNSVSLTLGLHQNTHTVCMPEMNVARNFVLEECNNPYVLGAFEGQEIRQY
ncbi:BEL1-like homeodomain protein 9 [Platanthera zijinensis]|uniref:BEL1-like homeodomain protein 9 n=1 Tax=Platanthera zijinensis TaxID=2320716 RepID=A0AAP0B557_9ASPA